MPPVRVELAAGRGRPDRPFWVCAAVPTGFPDAGGITSGSRWLRSTATTPPDPVAPIYSTPAGVPALSMIPRMTTLSKCQARARRSRGDAV